MDLFTYLNLAPEPELTRALVDKRVVGIAYETVQLPNRTLPLLTPMSEVAGKMATQIGAHYLEKVPGGKGILLGGVSGVQRGKVTGSAVYCGRRCARSIIWFTISIKEASGLPEASFILRLQARQLFFLSSR